MWNKIQSYIAFLFLPCIGAGIATGLYHPQTRVDEGLLFLIYLVVFAFYEKGGEILYDYSLSKFKPRCSHCAVEVVCPKCSSKRVYSVCPECSSKKLPFE